MKVLLNCPIAFALAHGGAQIQIEQTAVALKHNGVDVDFLKWWDGTQKADLIHHWGRMPADHIRLAQQKGIRVVMGELLTATGSRTPAQLRLQKFISQAIQRFAPRGFIGSYQWESYRLADAFVALTPWEKHLMEYLFDAAPEKVFVVGNGVEDVFLNAPSTSRGPWLICTATITERKRVLELAQAAVQAQTPLRVIGRAYAETDSYAQQFYELARRHPQTLRYEGGMDDRAKLAGVYATARGFALLSTMESLSLSALEAAATGCPLLLSALPWSRGTFKNAATYCPVTLSVEATARVLRSFYDAAPGLPLPPKPPTWNEIGRQLKTIYEHALNGK